MCLFFDSWNEVSAVLDYQDSKEGGQILESTTIHADIRYIIGRYIHVYAVYWYHYRNETSTVKFILVIHFCYLHILHSVLFFPAGISSLQGHRIEIIIRSIDARTQPCAGEEEGEA